MIDSPGGIVMGSYPSRLLRVLLWPRISWGKLGGISDLTLVFFSFVSVL